MSKKAEEMAKTACSDSGFGGNSERIGFYRRAFMDGYEQAEKDLELTIDDIKEITHIYKLTEVTLGTLGKTVSDDLHFKWILDEYKDRKNNG